MHLEKLAEEAILWGSLLSLGMLVVELLVSLLLGPPGARG